MSRSAFSSPSRKKLRLSSPTYDDHFDELDGFDFRILDEIETSFSCGDLGSPPKSPTNALDRRGKRRRAIEDALKAVKFDDLDDSGIAFVGPQDSSEDVPPKSPASHPQRSISGASTLTPAASLPLVADAPKDDIVPNPSSTTFLPVSMLVSTERLNCALRRSSQSLKEPVEHDHDAGFAPADTTLVSTHAHTFVSSFHDPQLTSKSATDLELPGIEALSMDNLLQRSKSSWAFPSADSLDRAKKKHQKWEAEIETEIETELYAVGRAQEIESVKQADNKPPAINVINRQPLKGVENSVSSPTISRITPDASASPTALDPRPTSAPVRPFKAPALATSRSCSDIPTPSCPHVAPFASVVSRSSAAADHAFSGAPVAPSVRLPPGTPVRRDSLHTHPGSQTPVPSTLPKPFGSSYHQSTTPQKARPLGLSPRARAFTSSRARPKFVTPFKQGKRPDMNTLQSSQPKADIQLREKGKGHEVVPTSVDEVKACTKNLVEPVEHSNRIALANSKLVPRNYDPEMFNKMGLDVNILSVPTTSHFVKYTFNSTGIDTLSAQKPLGSESALVTMLATGCHLATKAWVDNHWSLILWKILGMAYLEPAEVDKKWCWDEAMRQLRYRYKRELAGGSRPALRLIVAQDAPSSGPLVLCISNIYWTDECVDAEGHIIPAHPELEVTDGWYLLRATVDDVLARAARKKHLRIGRKIACSGAKLDSTKNVPMEVLDAYGSAHLVLSGNSTHLAPWHAKLGFQSAPFIATLRSLTSDGGVVPLVDLIITQVHPVGYLEFLTTDQGATIREGPRTEQDEALEEDRWSARRSHEAAKLRDKLERRWHQLELCADRLEQISGSGFRPTEDDSPPERVEDLVELLADSEDPASAIRQVNKADAGWLSLLLRKKCEADREQSGDEIDRELASSFPPRQVRNFRVLYVRDARSVRKPSWRTAQLTVWDVMSLNITEGGSPGAFNVEQRYLVSSLVPTHQSSWMGLDPGSEIHLNTRRDSKWKLIK